MAWSIQSNYKIVNDFFLSNFNLQHFQKCSEKNCPAIFHITAISRDQEKIQLEIIRTNFPNHTEKAQSTRTQMRVASNSGCETRSSQVRHLNDDDLDVGLKPIECHNPIERISDNDNIVMSEHKMMPMTPNVRPDLVPEKILSDITLNDELYFIIKWKNTINKDLGNFFYNLKTFSIEGNLVI